MRRADRGDMGLYVRTGQPAAILARVAWALVPAMVDLCRQPLQSARGRPTAGDVDGYGEWP